MTSLLFHYPRLFHCVFLALQLRFINLRRMQILSKLFDLHHVGT